MKRLSTSLFGGSVRHIFILSPYLTAPPEREQHTRCAERDSSSSRVVSSQDREHVIQRVDITMAGVQLIEEPLCLVGHTYTPPHHPQSITLSVDQWRLIFCHWLRRKPASPQKGRPEIRALQRADVRGQRRDQLGRIRPEGA